MIQAIIIDQNPKSLQDLKLLLSTNFSDIEVCECPIMKKAPGMVAKNKPNIIFVNIPHGDERSFEMLDNIKHKGHRVILYSESNQFAAEAFDYNAVDYLLKPISLEKLNRAIKSYKDQTVQVDKGDNIRSAFQEELGCFNNKKIVLHTSQNVYLVSLGEIIRCKADKNYTYFFLTNGKQITVSKNIDKYVNLLKPYGFIRPHKSHLVNINHIIILKKSNGWHVLLSDDTVVPVSLRKRKEIVDFLNNNFLCND